MISKDEVQHIAKLARLELTDAEIEKMQKDLSAVLDYFNVLKKAPKPPKAARSLSSESSGGRKDEVVSSHDVRGKIIGQAPDKKDDYIKVKAIL